MNERLTTYDSKMTKTINNLDGELATIRAGRANPHVLDKLTVDYYGSPTPIQQVAKDVKKKGEAAKVAVRNIRRDGNVAFKKLKGTEVSEDEIKDLEDDLQKITDKYIEKIDKMVEVKTKEIMTV